MNTVFIGGSRAVSRLPAQAQERLNNVIQVGAKVIVGDANGTDKAVQKFFASRNYPWVTVYCSGDECRNNIGHWATRHIDPPKGAHGFDFYAAKDRIMAREADYELDDLGWKKRRNDSQHPSPGQRRQESRLDQYARKERCQL